MKLAVSWDWWIDQKIYVSNAVWVLKTCNKDLDITLECFDRRYIINVAGDLKVNKFQRALLRCHAWTALKLIWAVERFALSLVILHTVVELPPSASRLINLPRFLYAHLIIPILPRILPELVPRLADRVQRMNEGRVLDFAMYFSLRSSTARDAEDILVPHLMLPQSPGSNRPTSILNQAFAFYPKAIEIMQQVSFSALQDPNEASETLRQKLCELFTGAPDGTFARVSRFQALYGDPAIVQEVFNVHW